MIFDFFEDYRPRIKSRIQEFMQTRMERFSAVNQWGKDTIGRIAEFSTRGKMIRGALVEFTAGMLGRPGTPEALDLAMAMELIQSGFLIHDDIMDRDELRRGLPTISAHYAELGKKGGYSDPAHFGLSMGICAGDIAFFLANDINSCLDAADHIKLALQDKITTEIIKVGLAQMEDVFFGARPEIPLEKEILNVYRFKTARYTFSLPMACGAIVAGRDKTLIEKLETLGELFGIIFQVKDDELGLFGTTDDIGKVAGSDISEGKKTIFTSLLLEKAATAEKKQIESILSKPGATDAEVRMVQEMARSYNITGLVNEKVHYLAENARAICAELPVTADYKAALEELLVYNLERKK